MGDLIGLRTRLWAVLAVIAGIALYLLLELREEPHMSSADMAFELLDIVPTVLTSVGVILLFQVSRRQQGEQRTLIHDLELARVQGQRWRGEARGLLTGLGEAIEVQFSRWSLTEAEREIALLLLKGLSLKEIATLRATSDRTVRVQTRALYAKAGINGRAALSAFFLEDLLAPIEGVK
ncbi:MAG TPA: LuxR C-terminal-related transcriptional regulator [Myxococcota bacterium]|nr:LuxR C-terminal-related transcriptional regulator [Myxococcota bacterium]